MLRILEQTYIRVPADQIAVIFNSESKGFSRFLLPGRHWLIPFLEYIEAAISTEVGFVKGNCINVSTCGGLPVSVEWSLFYQLNPFIAEPDMWPRLARILPHKTENLAQSQIDNYLRQLLNCLTVDQLSRPGARSRLQHQLENVVNERLTSFGFCNCRILLGAIVMSPQVIATLEAAYERRIQAEGLRRIKWLVEQFSDCDMKKLEKLVPLLAWDLHENQLAVKVNNQ